MFTNKQVLAGILILESLFSSCALPVVASEGFVLKKDGEIYGGMLVLDDTATLILTNPEGGGTVLVQAGSSGPRVQLGGGGRGAITLETTKLGALVSFGDYWLWKTDEGLFAVSVGPKHDGETRAVRLVGFGEYELGSPPLDVADVPVPEVISNALRRLEAIRNN